MKFKIPALLFTGLNLLAGYFHSAAQKRKTENVMLITMDGMRRIRAMKEADSSLFVNDKTITTFKNQIQRKHRALIPGIP